mgnify:CR=1 FL=1
MAEHMQCEVTSLGKLFDIDENLDELDPCFASTWTHDKIMIKTNDISNFSPMNLGSQRALTLLQTHSHQLDVEVTS